MTVISSLDVESYIVALLNRALTGFSGFDINKKTDITGDVFSVSKEFFLIRNVFLDQMPDDDLVFKVERICNDASVIINQLPRDEKTLLMNAVRQRRSRIYRGSERSALEERLRSVLITEMSDKNIKEVID